MTKQKQFNNKTGAVLTQTTPEQDRSLIAVPEELRRTYPPQFAYVFSKTYLVGTSKPFSLKYLAAPG